MLTPDELLQRYADAIRLFDRYRYSKKAASAQVSLMTEGVTRIWQLHYALSQSITLERDFEARLKRLHALRSADPSSENEAAMMEARLDSTGDRLEFYAESYYYLAHRLLKLSRLLPELKGFQVVGVRDVRNWLIEHPLALNRSYSYGEVQGLKLKPFRGPDDRGAPFDAGLFVNAEEFIEKLLPKLRDAVGEP